MADNEISYHFSKPEKQKACKIKHMDSEDNSGKLTTNITTHRSSYIILPLEYSLMHPQTALVSAVAKKSICL